MYFTLKIIRFLLQLALKVVLFPFRLLRSAFQTVSGSSADSEYEVSIDHKDAGGDSADASVESTTSNREVDTTRDSDDTTNSEGVVSASDEVASTADMDSPSGDDGRRRTDTGDSSLSIADTTENRRSAPTGEQFADTRLRRFEWKSALTENHEQTGTKRVSGAVVNSSKNDQTAASTETVAEPDNKGPSASTDEESTSGINNGAPSGPATAAPEAESAQTDVSQSEGGVESTTEVASTTTPDKTAEIDGPKETTESLEKSAVSAPQASDQLTAKDPETRERAIRELVQDGEDTTLNQPVIKALIKRAESDESDSVRVAACEALATVGTNRAREALEALRLDPSIEVSRAATRALRNFDETE